MANIYDKNLMYILKKLCYSLIGHRKDLLDSISKKALENIVTFDDAVFEVSFSPFEEYQICKEIENVLKERYSNSQEIIDRFHVLSGVVKDNSTESCDVYPQMLLFLLRLSQPHTSGENQLHQLSENEINANINSSDSLSTPEYMNSTLYVSSQHYHSTITSNISLNSIQHVVNGNSAGTTKVDYGRTDVPNANNVSNTDELTATATPSPVIEPKSVNGESSPVVKKANVNHLFSDTPILEPRITSSRKGSEYKLKVESRFTSSVNNESSDPIRPDKLTVNSRIIDFKRNDIIGDFEISEYEIMKELIFCMQGIEGKVIKYMSVEEGFHLNPCVKIDQPYLVRHLMELGYLHNKVKHYINTEYADVGTVAQGLVNAVRKELTQYYQALAVLDSQLNIPPEVVDTPLSEEECNKYKLPSLSQLFVWSRKQFLILQTLCDVLHTVKDKRGGQIVSDLAFLANHGNSQVRQIILRLLSSAVQPFYKQICYWVVNGEIIDTHQEFFIKREDTVDNVDYRNSWDRQFTLRFSMIPKYMSLEEANEILDAGRCMNFLHNICRERPPSTKAQLTLLELEKNKWHDPLSLIKPGSHISELINGACREVSKTVLKSLNENFKMRIHLEAMRKYMLLGQGDFIHYLLEIIEPDLNKCVGGTMHTYTLMRSLEDAIYKSNAQFDDADVLNKLCVKMMVTLERESASEAFCLQYMLEGPLNTILKSSMVAYNRMFTFMWRVKRANYMVLKMWRGLKLLFKEVSRIIPEVRSIFSKVNCLVMEMVNFIGHFQYYIASEVVEVSWRRFQSKLNSMESLEKVLQAHSNFLESMQTSCLLNAKSESSQATMAWHIRTLLDYVQELVPVVEMFQTLCESEVERRRNRQQNIAKFGISSHDQNENDTIINQFQEEMNKVKTKFKLLTDQHQDKLKSLLMLFSENQQEHNLILLSHRIDFNEYYKQNDIRLSNSLRLYKQYDY